MRTEEIKEEFVDPAIVSYGRHGTQSTQHPLGSQPDTAATSVAFQIPQAVGHLTQALPTTPTQTSKPAAVGKNNNLPGARLANQQENIPPSATLSAPFNDLSLNGQVPEARINVTELEISNPRTNEISRHDEVPSEKPGEIIGKRRKSGAKVSVSTHTQTVPESVPPTTPLSAQKRRSRQQKGWRQTPLLSESTATDKKSPRPSAAVITPKRGLRPPPDRNSQPVMNRAMRRRRRFQEEREQNGWATGEITDIQDMGDFDFEQNLSKFDKRKIFDQIRQDDTTADEARLVSFNRLPQAKPGTAGGKNLHYTENVLELLAKKIVEHSSDSDLAVSEPRRSKTSTRRVPSRKGSALIAGDRHGSGSTFVTDSVGMARQRSNHSRADSPKIRTDSSTGYNKSTTQTPKPSLCFTSTNRPCPVISPLQMLELEQLAVSELGLIEEVMAETAARSIAETAYHLSTTEDKENPGHWSTPLIVVLAGNHRTGSRAIAAARHLHNHGAHVILCILGLEREDDLLDSVRRQLRILRNCGGQAIKQDALMRTLRKMQASADLVVDAMLGMHICFDDLGGDDQAAYFQLKCWANDGEAPILSIDIPSGIDASSGILTSQATQPLHVHATHVLSLGAPKTGLLAALGRVECVDSLGLYVADIGISPTAWKKFGTRRRHGVEFGGEWVVAVVYDRGVMDSEVVEGDAKWL